MAPKDAVLIIGSEGQLAKCLAAAATGRHMTPLTAGRQSVDITDADAVNRLIDRVRPAFIVNAAAYTAVDKAEQDADEAYRVNCKGAATLAASAEVNHLPFLHVSTDYVFDGLGTAPYRVDTPPNPLGVYGRTKRDGEVAVLDMCPAAVVARTSWVYSVHGHNFLNSMLRLASQRDTLQIVNDQEGSPTSAHDLADALLDIGLRLARENNRGAGGVYHLTNGGSTSWFGFARAIFDGASEYGVRKPQLVPITTAQFPTPAKRPAYSVLDCGKTAATFGVTLPQWQQSLTRCIAMHPGIKELQPC